MAKGKGIKVAEFLLSYKPDVIVAGESLLKKGPGYAFADAGVETMQTDAKSLGELVDQMLVESNQPRQTLFRHSDKAH